MTIQEFYGSISGNYQEAVGRMMRDALVQRFALKFPKDPSFDELKAQMAAGNVQEAFRAAHTLKGVCRNLAFTRLGDLASDVTEALRAGDMALAVTLMPALESDYAHTIDRLAELAASVQ